MQEQSNEKAFPIIARYAHKEDEHLMVGFYFMRWLSRA